MRFSHELFTNNYDGIFNHHAGGDHPRYSAGGVKLASVCARHAGAHREDAAANRILALEIE